MLCTVLYINCLIHCFNSHHPVLFFRFTYIHTGWAARLLHDASTICPAVYKWLPVWSLCDVCHQAESWLSGKGPWCWDSPPWSCHPRSSHMLLWPLQFFSHLLRWSRWFWEQSHFVGAGTEQRGGRSILWHNVWCGKYRQQDTCVQVPRHRTRYGCLPVEMSFIGCSYCLSLSWMYSVAIDTLEQLNIFFCMSRPIHLAKFALHMMQFRLYRVTTTGMCL